MIVFPFALGDCILFLGAIDGLRKVYPKDRYSDTIKRYVSKIGVKKK